METDPTAVAPEVSFNVEYQAPSGASNADLKGTGVFTASPVAPHYRFTGIRRSLFGKAATVEFQADHIWNVTFSGRRVQFETSRGISGGNGTPFVFYCATPDDAAQAALLLPRVKDSGFFERQSFAAQLARLPAASSRWTCITNLIIAANVVAFVIMGFLGAGWISVDSMEPYLLFAANNGAATTDGEWWRLVTCMFVHYGLLHLALNMWALFQAGHFVERLLGRPLFLLAYFGSGITASFATLFWNGDKVWSAGASGAVFGVYGVLLGFMLREKQSIPKSVLQPMLKSTLMFAGYNLIFGLTIPHIDNSAHIGGFLGGIAFGWLLAMPLDTAVRARRSALRLQLGIAALIAIAALGVAFAPRFDYSVREKLQWEDLLRGFAPQETALAEQQQRIMAAYTRSQDATELTRWLEKEAIPAYESLLGRIDSLRLDPKRATAAQRTRLRPIVEAEISSYRQYLQRLRSEAPAEPGAGQTAGSVI